MRNVWGVASALALVAQPWPTTLLQSLWEKMGLALLPVLYTTLVTHDLAPVAGLSDLFMHAAQAFELPRYQRRVLAHNYEASSPLRGPAHACSSTRLVLDTLEYFRLYDAEKRSAFVDAFLAATASKLEANTVFRNLELRESASDIRLAKAGLERLLSAPLRGSEVPKLNTLTLSELDMYNFTTNWHRAKALRASNANDAAMRKQFQRLAERPSPTTR
ncbi:hypothetical protein SPRG_17381 [Saprolegnia parasitica CBS 223.65]|uniref:Uncharacterized protein n=1 Tax=Saprolegnia parasitica (strain CBS 223.65) TaxID=695850 RepID=A0A067BF15_SAPPC|nr:hypothetical protein SPRG_17381 [Saprolegnia parasitica CBS 223.65]KDO16984.1 hypothetical protein SPRG_17381 [Saprolegnia parasitica CBS 223.65]|eukprot:XP_012212307.1 hypothetical protein SPRG_17381 [Saprolegnia parasitica CBS 223.65]